MISLTVAQLFLLISTVSSQQPGNLTQEVHPQLPSKVCTYSGGCIASNTSIVLDGNSRWLHDLSGTTNCVTKGFNRTLCPDPETCAKNCMLEGVDYSSHGLKTTGDSVTMNLFVSKDNKPSLASPRIYLFDESKDRYANFRLLNQEFTFDVDMSKAGCGVNGALYFSEMDLTGDENELNKAGAKYGTGYCDAQCGKSNFIKGKADLNHTYGACCNEMDIWEANSAATAFTLHPCNITGFYACTEPSCGTANHYGGVCDKDGCDFNGYRNGAKSFYGKGPNKSIDTSRPFTVVTQFLTHNKSANGLLSEVRRIYLQNGKQIPEASVAVKGLDPVNSVTDGYCSAQKTVFGGSNSPNAFKTQGGMKQMGEALGRGMVLAMSIWYDAGSYMQWLDSTVPENAAPGSPGAARGPCPTTGGRPAQIEAEQPDAAITFSNIRIGDIGSTYR